MDILLSNISKEFMNISNNFPGKKTLKLSKEIVDSKNNIYILGVGKSETIALHLVNLLKSVGVRIFNLNVLNALHGDIGTLKENDLVILFSKSGNTNELVQLSKYIKMKTSDIWGICCEENSLFEEICKEVIVLPFFKELESKVVKTLPTNSCLVQLIFSNILSVMVGNQLSLTLDEYKINHPAGNIGEKLVKVKDIMITEFPIIVLNKQILLQEVLLQMTRYSIGCCFFVKNNILMGLLSDGDIRRLLVKDINIKYIELEDINLKYYFETDIEKLVSDIKVIKRKKFIPVLDGNNCLQGIIKF